jgi:hypothetical protein
MAKAAAPVEELVSKIKHGELQERNGAGSEKSGELLFWEAGDALDYQGQLQDHGAISGRRKLPWPYRQPDAVRDDLPARLLALNAERYAPEVALGLHSNAGMQAAKAGSGTRRWRTNKGSQE